jgi:hypothetical protein
VSKKLTLREKERVEAARIAAGVSQSSGPEGLSEVTSFLERFEAEQKKARTKARTGLTTGARSPQAPVVYFAMIPPYFATKRRHAAVAASWAASIRADSSAWTSRWSSTTMRPSTTTVSTFVGCAW